MINLPPHSEESKEKIRGEKNKNWKGGVSKRQNETTIRIKRNGVKTFIRKCRFCLDYKINKQRKIICDDCKTSYYKFYRPLCEFDFRLEDYPDKFDFTLIDKHGKYSPSNKGNNLNGVSRDHLYSVRDGFVNKIDPEIIKHPANCGLLKHIDNNKKKTNSIITIEELKERIKNW